MKAARSLFGHEPSAASPVHTGVPPSRFDIVRPRPDVDADGNTASPSGAVGPAINWAVVSDHLGASPALLGAPVPGQGQAVQPMLFPFASWGKFSTLVQGLKSGTLPSAFTLHIVLLKPDSVGEVRLNSKYDGASPEIDPNYLANAVGLEQHDV